MKEMSSLTTAGKVVGICGTMGGRTETLFSAALSAFSEDEEEAEIGEATDSTDDCSLDDEATGAGGG